MLKFLTIFSIFVLLAVGVIYFIFRSSFLRVAGIEVLGSQKGEEIKQELIPILVKASGFRVWLGPGNLLFWSLKTQKIPSSLFWLSDLSLVRNWQQKKIFIEVKEREPWLLWCLVAGSRCYWLDEQGIVFSFASEAEGFIIPKVFEENERQQLLFGQPFLDNPALVKNVLEIIKQLKNSSLTSSRFLVKNINLQEIEAETNGPKLYLNFRLPPPNLNDFLINLARRLDLQKLEYIDFRVENRIYYK